MAFYKVRVDESGNEIDRPQTSRSYNIHHLDGFFSNRRTASQNGMLVRFINPAAFIEKSQDTDTFEGSISEIVPPLDLNSSGETLPSESGNDANFTVQKTCEISKITKSDAFSNWLSAKRKLKSYEIAKKREIENEKQRLAKEKKAIAEQKYREWLKRKEQTKEKPPAERQMQEYQVYHPNDDDSESNRRAWEQRKQEELRRKREEQLRANQEKKLIEEKRKQEAGRAWENWLAGAPLKPKPVPLNQGLLTLKGTVSQIYVNPNPWRDMYVGDECD